MPFLHAGITVQLELKWLITSPKQSIGLIPLHQLESLVCTMPDDLLYILNMILLYVLRIVDHNPVISLKSSYTYLASKKGESLSNKWRIEPVHALPTFFFLHSNIWVSRAPLHKHRNLTMEKCNFISRAMKDLKMKLWFLENVKQAIYIHLHDLS